MYHMRMAAVQRKMRALHRKLKHDMKMKDMTVAVGKRHARRKGGAKKMYEVVNPTDQQSLLHEGDAYIRFMRKDMERDYLDMDEFYRQNPELA